MSDLAYVLRLLPSYHDPNLLVGSNPADDAAVYRLRDDLALVQTVDFFTPIVDDPYTFGQIAVANSLSDVYAMGGTPVTALNIVGFPIKTVPVDVLAAILLGGAAKAAEAGVPIVGGHTIDDAEPKYGLAVTGTVDPSRYLSARGAKPGDLLVLTKPLGTGVVSTALKAEVADGGDVRNAITWMTTLNRTASRAMVAAEAHASTDITGYGVLGHLTELCRASRCAARIDVRAVPFLPGALEYGRAGFLPGGLHTNMEATRALLEVNADVDEVEVLLLADPQTSGGLLVALPSANLRTFRRHAAEDMLTAVIGQVVAGPAGHLTIESSWLAGLDS